jgi:3-hydroxybutyryl-CoA dehydrogenase
VKDVEELSSIRADAYFHLGYEEDTASIHKLARITGPVFINSVTEALIDSEHLAAAQENCQLIRINAWPTFLKRDITELCIADPFDESTVKEVFRQLGWKYRIVPDVPGMISPRVVAMIINEAYFTLQAGVSTKEEIDTAMKLGTNYPYGPFEWAEKIGLNRIKTLLQTLSKTDTRYLPAENLG